MKTVLKDEICKETFAKAGVGAAKSLVSKGRIGGGATGKTKAALTRMKNAGEIKTTKSGSVSFTAKGKKKYA